MKDALGNDIQIGKLYGHSARTSGFVTVVIGEAKEFNENGVELHITHRGQASFDNEVKTAKIGRSIINVLSNSLFPITETISWMPSDKMEKIK